MPQEAVYIIPRLVFVDDTFAANTSTSKEHTFEICVEMEKRHLKIPFMVDTRIDCIDRELFAKLKSVGLQRVFIGIEAKDIKTLQAYNKGYCIDKSYMDEKLTILRDLEISIVYGVMPLYPEVELNELENNIDFIFSLPESDPFMFLKEFVPYPGTVLTEQYISKGLVIGEFPEYMIHYANEGVERIQEYYNILLDKYFIMVVLLNVDYKFYLDEHYFSFIQKTKNIFYNYLKDLIQIAKNDGKMNEYLASLNKSILNYKEEIHNQCH